eukprot:564469_1
MSSFIICSNHSCISIVFICSDVAACGHDDDTMNDGTYYILCFQYHHTYYMFQSFNFNGLLTMFTDVVVPRDQDDLDIPIVSDVEDAAMNDKTDDDESHVPAVTDVSRRRRNLANGRNRGRNVLRSVNTNVADTHVVADGNDGDGRRGRKRSFREMDDFQEEDRADQVQVNNTNSYRVLARKLKLRTRKSHDSKRQRKNFV